MLDFVIKNPSIYRQRVVTAAITFGTLIFFIALISIAICWQVNTFWSLVFSNIALLATLLAVLIGHGFQRGMWEGLFTKEPKLEEKDEPLIDMRDKLSKCSRVFFVGHSLGGALALLSFSLYRSWSLLNGKDNGHVITFGAPSPGDQEFIDDFEKKNEGRFCHVVDPRDPVPLMPAQRYKTSARLQGKGILGILVFGLGHLWALFAALGNQWYGQWRGGVLQIVLSAGSEGIQVRFHDMKRYEAAIKRQVNWPFDKTASSATVGSKPVR